MMFQALVVEHLKVINTTADSASAHVTVRWRPWSPGVPSGSARVYVDPQDPTKIIRADILLADWLTSNNVRRHVTLEEAAHIIYDCVDIQNQEYEQSIFYKGGFLLDLSGMDIPAGIVASKLPRRYRRNQ